MRIAGILLAILLLPSFAYAALININTADVALLDTLPGIGPTKASAIIAYRTANGPFAQIQDIQNVSGIGAATYADIAPLITVGSSSSSSSSSTASSTANTSATTSPASTAIAEYLTRPALRITGVSDRVVSVGADTVFAAVVYDGKGNRRPDATASWSFGDGTHRIGTNVYHAYYAPGEYIVMVRASVPEGDEAEFEVLVTAKEARLAIQDISDKGITLINHDSRVVDLSGWRLTAGEREFKIPLDTFMLGSRTLTLSSRVTGLQFVGSASLLYPNGDIADIYPHVVEKVLLAPKAEVTASASYAPAQAVTSPVPQKEQIEETEDISLAAAATAVSEEPEEESSSEGILPSPWVLGLLSLVILSGAAFVFL